MIYHRLGNFKNILPLLNFFQKIPIFEKIYKNWHLRHVSNCTAQSSGVGKFFGGSETLINKFMKLNLIPYLVPWYLIFTSYLPGLQTIFERYQLKKSQHQNLKILENYTPHHNNEALTRPICFHLSEKTVIHFQHTCANTPRNPSV